MPNRAIIVRCNKLLVRLDKLQGRSRNLPQDMRAYVFTAPRRVMELIGVFKYETGSRPTTEQMVDLCVIEQQTDAIQAVLKKHKSVASD